MAYQLQSKLFTKNAEIRKRLQRIAEFDADHVQEPSAEDCVSVLQEALFLLVPDVNLSNKELAGVFGAGTADAVFRFKRAPDLNGTGKKILRSGQIEPDRIIGIQTIEAMDRMLLKKQPAAPAPVTTKKKQDIVIWIQGAGVEFHGQPDAAHFASLTASLAQSLASKKDDYEKKFVFPPLVISFFGAPRSSAANPERKIRATIAALRKAGKFDIGRVFVWGSSIGGINAMHLSAGLNADGVPQALLGIGDAAFSFFDHSRQEKSTDGRTITIFDKPNGMSAELMSSTFQTWGNDLTTFFGFISELHGAILGVPRHDVSNTPRVKNQIDKWIADGRPGGDRKNSLWQGMHDAAVGLGETKFLSEMSGILTKF